MTDLPYLTTQDMADLTGKSRDFWARLCRTKTLPGIKLGTDWRVSRAAFEAFMSGGAQATARKRSARQQKRSA